MATKSSRTNRTTKFSYSEIDSDVDMSDSEGVARLARRVRQQALGGGTSTSKKAGDTYETFNYPPGLVLVNAPPSASNNTLN